MIMLPLVTSTSGLQNSILNDNNIAPTFDYMCSHVICINCRLSKLITNQNTSKKTIKRRGREDEKVFGSILIFFKNYIYINMIKKNIKK
jgi:hypothetical protein